MLTDRTIKRDDKMHLIDVHQGVAERARHLHIYLGNDGFSYFSCRYGQARFGAH